MKAAVIFRKGEMPQYTDFPEPTINDADQLVIIVKAAALKNLDRGLAKGTHYSVENRSPNAKIIGGDGVGILADGTRIYALGEGMMAEKAIIDQKKMVKIPDGLDNATAAAIPNAVAGSAMALRFRAGVRRGETVLINGATGVTGKIAIQVAKYYGAGKVIVTGRNEDSLKALSALGADEMVLTGQSNEAFIEQIRDIHRRTPIDIIIDYLWGNTAELLLTALKGYGSYQHKTRFVSVGSVTGDIIQLSAENLRSVDLQLSGSGLGSWTREEMSLLFKEIIPEMFQLAAEHKLKIDTVEVPLQDIEKIWEMESQNGKRLVIAI